MSVITLNEVSKSYQGRSLYSRINAEIAEGKITALVGPNGSGKSVLFKLMVGFLRPDEGHVTVHPRYLSRGRTFPERFGIVIDRPGYISHLSGFDNLAALARIRKQVGASEITATMHRVGLDPTARQKVRNYSLGMKQKLALAQALMEQPEVLVLDEPFNALDHHSVENVRELLREYRKDGHTVAFTSHNQEDVDLLADHVLEIKDGQLLARDARQPA